MDQPPVGSPPAQPREQPYEQQYGQPYGQPYERPYERPPQNASTSSRTLFALLAASLIVILLGAVIVLGTRFVVVGSGTSKTEARTISGVTQVDLSGSGTLTIRQGAAEALTVTADDNLLADVQTTVSGGRLTLGMRNPGFSIFIPRTTVHYDLTVKTLTALQISGSGDATMTGLQTSALTLAISGSGSLNLAGLSATTLTTSISGSGNMTVAGQVQSQSVMVSGSGTYRGRDLASATAQVTVSGSGNVTVQVSQRLDAQISGSGNVTYTGDPATVTQHVSGSGTITKG